MWRPLLSLAASASIFLLLDCTDQPVEPSQYGVGDAAVSKTPVPAPPGNAVATGVSETQIDVSWADNSTNETRFELYRSSAGVAGPFALLATLAANVTGYSDRKLENGTVFCYQIRAIRVYGSKAVASAFSDMACAVAPPAAPSNLAAVATSWPRVALTWQDNSSLETTYEVLRSTDGENGTFSVVYGGEDVVSVIDAMVTTGIRYCYRVRAARQYPTNSPPYRDFVYSAPSNTACATPPPPAEPPPSAYQLRTWPGSSTTVTLALTWNDSSMPAPAFRAYRSTDGGASWTLVTLSGDANGYTDGPLASEQRVCHRVIAYNVAGDAAPSNQSCVTPPAGPTGLTIARVDESTVELRWTDNSAVEDGYSVAARWYRGSFYCYPPGSGARDAGTFEGEAVWAELGPNVTTYRTAVIDSCDPPTIYWFSVVALKDGGSSNSTDEVSTQDLIPLP